MSTSTPKVSSARLPVLKPPGPNSNYLDWKIVVGAYFRAAKVQYVLQEMEVKQRPPTWADGNNSVVSVILHVVDSANLCYIREFKEDAWGMWEALSKDHQDCSTGSQVFWIRKLLLTKMEGDNIDTHIDTMAKYHECLNSLITPDDVHTAALLSFIPKDWVVCVSNLMNQEGVESTTIFSALKNKSI
jgi:hypothetical protein